MAFRGFIAVDFAPSRSLSDVMQELKTSGASLKLVPAEHFHSTLKFLGDTEEGLADEIVGIMRKACEGHPPFRAMLQGTGAFPSLSRMNVIWVGIEGARPLADIAARALVRDRIPLAVVHGRDLRSLRNAILGRPFHGTMVTD